MKQASIFFLAAALLVLTAIRPGLGEEIERVVLADSPWPPYSVGEIGRPAEGGLGVELIHTIFQKLGVAVEIQLRPWNRVLKSAETGRVDGTSLLMKTPDREKFLLYTVPVFQARECLFYRTARLGEFQWTSFKDLKGYKIGLVDGYTYGPEFLAAVKSEALTTETAASAEMNFKKLFAGRIDFYLEDDVVARAVINNNQDYRQALSMAAKPVSTYDLYLSFSRLSPAAALVPQVNRIIEEMKADGAIDRILGRTR